VEIGHAKVRLTVSGGQIVYDRDRPALAPNDTLGVAK
jgi:hypothetical protein